MKRIKGFVIIILLISPSVLFAQKKVKDILLVSDSIVRKTVGDTLFQYFEISEGSFYTDTKWNTDKFLDKENIDKDIYKIWILYSFDYPHIKGLKGNMWVKLDNRLKLKEELHYKFIPDFLLEGKPSNFINSSTILDIAKETFSKRGLKILEPKLSFNNRLHIYVYTVTNILSKDKNEASQNAGEMEYCIINAVTGIVLEHRTGNYSLLIK